MQIFHKTRIPFLGKPAFVLSHYLLLCFFRYSVSHLDEDEYYRFVSSDYKECPYYRSGDEYKVVRHQM